MKRFSDETEDWRQRAARGEKPFGLYDHGAVVISLVHDGEFNISEDVKGQGFYHLRAADPIRTRPLKFEMRPVSQRTALDDHEVGVENNRLRGKLRLREPHFEAVAPDEDKTCRFTVENQGIECFETRCAKSVLTSSFLARTDPGPAVQVNSPIPKVDALVVTALKDEGDAVASVGERFGRWRTEAAASGVPYRWATFENDGLKMTVALARATDMGGTSAALIATGLLTHLMRAKKPAILAMAGICGGHPKNTYLGDVVVADRIFKFDEGKRQVIERTPNGETEETIFHDLTTFKIDAVLKHAVENFAATWSYAGHVARPKSIQYQTRWLLWTLHSHETGRAEYPRDIVDADVQCPNWGAAVARAEHLGLVTATERVCLTEAGRQEAERDKAFNRTIPQDPDTPRARIGAMGTSSWLQKDPGLFAKLQPLLRTILAVEMEAEAVARVAYEYRCRFLVAKSVVDYANLDKDDSFRLYSADTSADFLVSFLTTLEAARAMEIASS
jgi:nucleoside phosphorylase